MRDVRRQTMNTCPDMILGARVICYQRFGQSLTKNTLRKKQVSIDVCTCEITDTTPSPEFLAICLKLESQQYILVPCDQNWQPLEEDIFSSLNEALDEADFRYLGSLASWCWLNHKPAEAYSIRPSVTSSMSLSGSDSVEISGAFSPLLFLSYGRPDSLFANQLAAELWKRGIEIYNYQIGSLTDLSTFNRHHRTFLDHAMIIVAIISGGMSSRMPVMREIFGAIDRSQKSVYVTTPQLLHSEFAGDPDLLLDWPKLHSPAVAANTIIDWMEQVHRENCRQQMRENKTSHHATWKRLDDYYTQMHWPTSELPLPNIVLDKELGKGLGWHLQHELSKFSDSTNRDYFSHILLDLISYIDAETPNQIERHLSLSNAPPRIEARWDVRESAYRGEETLNHPADVLLGCARLSNKMGSLRPDDALEIAKRIVWTSTRSISLVSVYACSLSLGNYVVANACLTSITQTMK